MPKIASTTRTEIIAIERAKSLAMLVILDTLTPAAKSTSKRVTTGPGKASTTFASTLNSLSLISNKRDKRSNCSGVKPALRLVSGFSNKSKDGKVERLLGAAANNGLAIIA